ncbi:MAG: cardiolipin synthase ClsB [Betaproteobacteria bacterium]
MPDYVPGNRLTLLRNGEQYFPALVEAIDAAAREIFLETYIFADDQTGSLIADALARASARGVATRLLIDGFGGKDFPRRFRENLSNAGVRILIFRPKVSPWPPWRQRTRLRRMHRKMACVDGAVAFVGGINIIDDYHTPGQTPPRYDYAVRIEGPLATRVRAEASRLWSRVSWATLGRRWPGWRAMHRNPDHDVPGVPAVLPEGQSAALVVRDNLRHRRDIELAYLERIGAAREDIIIACAYFFPGRRFRLALGAAARRGVRVTLLLQGKVEYALLHYASRALYGRLLGAGVRIYEYHRSFLHAKVAVFDGDAACVGSSNIDPMSLLLAREANVFVEDRRFAGELRQSLLRAMHEGARRVPLRTWRRMSPLKRLAIWGGYRAARLLMAVYGYGREH